MTMRRRHLVVDGIRTPVLESGPGKASQAVVFIHGNPGSSADWSGLLTAVGHFARAVAWDAPGFGRADKPADFPQSVQGHAEFIERALEALGVARAHLVLHDFGGPWGLRWAVDHPDRFASTVLINTGALVGYRWHLPARVWRAPVVGEVSMAMLTRPGFHALIGRFGNPRGLPGDFLDRMYDDFDAATRRAVLRLYRATGRPGRGGDRLAGALRSLDRPALVIWGARDPYIPVEQAYRQRQAFPHAEVVVINDSGHWPFIDNPGLVEKLVCDWLRPHVTADGAS